MLILFQSFLGILLLNPHFFFHHIVVQVHASIWHFENSSPLLWNPRYSEKGDLPECFASTFILLCHFHMNLNMQNSWPNWLPTYCWQFSTGNHLHVKWSITQGDLISSNSNFFTLCLPWSISIARLFFKVSISILCVLIWPSHLFHTVCFKSSKRQSYDPSGKLQSCTLLGWFQSPNHFLTPPLWVIVCKSGNSDQSGPLFSKL